MGEVIHMDFKQARAVSAKSAGSSVLSADFVHGQSNRAQNAVLYNVGFDDALYWRIPKPYRHDYVFRGLVTTPDIVATKGSDQIRLVKMLDGAKPDRLDAHTIIMANLDGWVLASKLGREHRHLEIWVVFDDGGRFELEPTASLAQAHAELAMREMRIEGLHELSTSEAATMVLGETYCVS